MQSCDIVQELGGVVRFLPLSRLHLVFDRLDGAWPTAEAVCLHVQEPLADLLFASDAQAQVAAAGALLNILGHPETEENLTVDPAAPNPTREAVRKIFSTSLALGLVYDGLYSNQTAD